MQKSLFDTIEMEQCTPSHTQTRRMRKLLAEEKLTEESIYAIMEEEKPNQIEKLIIRDTRVQKLFPKDLPYSQREEYIIKAMEHYNRFRQRKEKQKEQER